MKSIILKSGAAAALLAVSAAAFASGMDCCMSIACCIKMLAGCC